MGGVWRGGGAQLAETWVSMLVENLGLRGGRCQSFSALYILYVHACICVCVYADRVNFQHEVFFSSSSLFWNYWYGVVLEQTRCSHVSCNSERVTVSFYHMFKKKKINQSDILTALFGCYIAGAMWDCFCSVYTIQPCTSLQCHFFQYHIYKVHVHFAVTCHLHFWQSDQDLLCASAVTRGWNRYQNKSAHRKLTMEKKTPGAPMGTQTCNLSVTSPALSPFSHSHSLWTWCVCSFCNVPDV